MSSVETLPSPMPEKPGIRELLEAQWRQGKFLCVGLDVTATDSAEELFENARLIIDSTSDIAAAYKPNSAFYERMGDRGVAALDRVVSYLSETAPSVPVIWDAKRADIANTNDGYRDAQTSLGADAITIHPYLGGSAVKPLLSDPGKAGFVLAHTSNPGAKEFQHLQLRNGDLLWEQVVKNVAKSGEWQHGGVLGIVAGATYPEELARARYLAGDDIVMLIPGVGTQGGDLEASVRGAMNSRSNGFLINVSSGISKAKTDGEVTRDSIRQAALNFHHQIHDVWQQERANPSLSYEEQQQQELHLQIGHALVAAGAIKFGKFVLRDTSESPVYVDLRNAISDPEVRDTIVRRYVDLITKLETARGEEFDLLAGIPEAATSFAAITAERMARHLIQPRAGGKKEYGAGGSIIGRFEPGQSVGLIDDLMTSGGAKLNTVKRLREEGLEVGGLAIILDREQGGREVLEAEGVPMANATTLRKLMDALGEEGTIEPGKVQETIDYLNSK